MKRNSLVAEKETNSQEILFDEINDIENRILLVSLDT